MSSMKAMSSLRMGFWVQTSALYDLVLSSSPSFMRLMASLQVNTDGVTQTQPPVWFCEGPEAPSRTADLPEELRGK
ncbi:hypothetical protein EYF80_029318 [Liparis tanakae]|uniref:Uncharacterized protein n=1 Tax=Liparis tanakae TaxID=230148 RepID=A0A4Z2H3N3_9TELE|nr:hypothetical protein EYF80_029318 [Liparis tanakae]